MPDNEIYFFINITTLSAKCQIVRLKVGRKKWKGVSGINKGIMSRELDQLIGLMNRKLNDKKIEYTMDTQLDDLTGNMNVQNEIGV